jgi:hypothetical protein
MVSIRIGMIRLVVAFLDGCVPLSISPDAGGFRFFYLDSWLRPVKKTRSLVTQAFSERSNDKMAMKKKPAKKPAAKKKSAKSKKKR